MSEEEEAENVCILSSYIDTLIHSVLTSYPHITTHNTNTNIATHNAGYGSIKDILTMHSLHHAIDSFTTSHHNLIATSTTFTNHSLVVTNTNRSLITHSNANTNAIDNTFDNTIDNAIDNGRNDNDGNKSKDDDDDVDIDVDMFGSLSLVFGSSNVMDFMNSDSIFRSYSVLGLFDDIAIANDVANDVGIDNIDNSIDMRMARDHQNHHQTLIDTANISTISDQLATFCQDPHLPRRHSQSMYLPLTTMQHWLTLVEMIIDIFTSNTCLSLSLDVNISAYLGTEAVCDYKSFNYDDKEDKEEMKEWRLNIFVGDKTLFAFPQLGQVLLNHALSVAKLLGDNDSIDSEKELSSSSSSSIVPSSLRVVTSVLFVLRRLIIPILNQCSQPSSSVDSIDVSSSTQWIRYWSCTTCRSDAASLLKFFILIAEYSSPLVPSSESSLMSKTRIPGGLQLRNKLYSLRGEASISILTDTPFPVPLLNENVLSSEWSNTVNSWCKVLEITKFARIDRAFKDLQHVTDATSKADIEMILAALSDIIAHPINQVSDVFVRSDWPSLHRLWLTFQLDIPKLLVMLQLLISAMLCWNADELRTSYSSESAEIDTDHSERVGAEKRKFLVAFEDDSSDDSQRDLCLDGTDDRARNSSGKSNNISSSSKLPDSNSSAITNSIFNLFCVMLHLLHSDGVPDVASLVTEFSIGELIGGLDELVLNAQSSLQKAKVDFPILRCIREHKMWQQLLEVMYNRDCKFVQLLSIRIQTFLD